MADDQLKDKAGKYAKGVAQRTAEREVSRAARLAVRSLFKKK
jgi:hypothetical protein